MEWTAPRRVESLSLVQFPSAHRVGRHRLSSVMPPTRPTEADQERLYRAIADALFRSAPEGWEHITLHIVATTAGHVQLTVSGPSGTPSLRVPDNSLFPPVYELYDLFALAG